MHQAELVSMAVSIQIGMPSTHGADALKDEWTTGFLGRRSRVPLP